jgi:aminoglycoside phosphotransferase (APT) family kinase protein
MDVDDVSQRLTSWFATQLPRATDVRVEGIDRAEVGHSAETLLLTVAWGAEGTDHREDVVVRVRPPQPGLLEPYDLKRQFEILRAVEPTGVRAPRALWYEGSGEVLGREFYVMERRDGVVYERTLPRELEDDAPRVRRMSESMTEQIAAIHAVDLHATGLDVLGAGTDYLDRELDHWEGEIRRLQRGEVPGLDRLIHELRRRQPEQSPRVTLVHGDPKHGNFAFVGDEVNGVFDWEMATLGDPLADLGWTEALWSMPGSFTTLPGSLTIDEFAARHEELTGIVATNREWYRALEYFKMAVIQFVGSMLFDAGYSDDIRFGEMGYAVPFITTLALAEFGIEDELESGPVAPRKKRMLEVRSRSGSA